MKRLLTSSLAALALMITAAPGVNTAMAQQQHGQGKAAGEPDPYALKKEMILLNRAYRDIVSGVALDNGRTVQKAIESMHGSIEATQEAMRGGAIKLPKNPERVNEFVKLDKEFHHDLEALASAAEKNDSPKMLSVTKKLLDGCVGCHQTFRK